MDCPHIATVREARKAESPDPEKDISSRQPRRPWGAQPGRAQVMAVDDEKFLAWYSFDTQTVDRQQPERDRVGGSLDNHTALPIARIHGTHVLLLKIPFAPEIDSHRTSYF